LKTSTYVLLDLPSKVEYALLALLEIASQHSRQTPLTVGDITDKQAIPERYLEQILGQLRRGGVLKSQRGAKGGYLLAQDPEQIKILDVVATIEGEHQWGAGSERLTPESQLIRHEWQKASLAAQSVLEDCSLKDLCDRRQAYGESGFMYYI
jgi:Rrf2 family protein